MIWRSSRKEDAKIWDVTLALNDVATEPSVLSERSIAKRVAMHGTSITVSIRGVLGQALPLVKRYVQAVRMVNSAVKIVVKLDQKELFPVPSATPEAATATAALVSSANPGPATPPLAAALLQHFQLSANELQSASADTTDDDGNVTGRVTSYVGLRFAPEAESKPSSARTRAEHLPVLLFRCVQCSLTPTRLVFLKSSTLPFTRI